MTYFSDIQKYQITFAFCFILEFDKQIWSIHPHAAFGLICISDSRLYWFWQFVCLYNFHTYTLKTSEYDQEMSLSQPTYQPMALRTQSIKKATRSRVYEKIHAQLN